MARRLLLGLLLVFLAVPVAAANQFVFKGVTFGMSMEQVKEIEKDLTLLKEDKYFPSSELVYEYTGNEFVENSHLYYFFHADRLYDVRIVKESVISFDAGAAFMAMYAEAAENIKALYGEPAESIVTWLDEWVAIPEDFDRNDTALGFVNGYTAYESVWKRDGDDNRFVHLEIVPQYPAESQRFVFIEVYAIWDK